MGTRAGMFPAAKNPECWAFYAIDDAAGIWVDLRAKDITDVLIKTQTVRTIADRYARTHWERNIIRTFMPGVPLNVTKHYNAANDTAFVVMEGYFPDLNTDAREVQKRLTDIAAGRIDAMDAKVAQFSVILGRENEAEMIEAQAIEEAEPEDAEDAITRPQPTPGVTAVEKNVSVDASTANELLRQIDTELFFGVTVDQAKTINEKYAPLANQPVEKLREILATLRAMQDKK
jgi:hypothetical protein